MDRLREYQLDRLRETLRLVRDKSRFYRERLAHFNPDDIRTMADLARLPFTTAADLAANPESFLCVPPSQIGRIVTLSTSGTTGRPKRLFFTDADQELTVDFFHRGMTTMAATGDRVMVFMPGTSPGSIGDLLAKGLARFGCPSIVYGPIVDFRDAYSALLQQKNRRVGRYSLPDSASDTHRHNKRKTGAEKYSAERRYGPPSLSSGLSRKPGTSRSTATTA